MIIMKAIYLDGTDAEAPLAPRAMVELERRYDVRFGDVFGTGADPDKQRFEHLWFAGWAALHFAGDPTATEDYDEWLAKIADVEPREEKKSRKRAAPPTKRASKSASTSG